MISFLIFSTLQHIHTRSKKPAKKFDRKKSISVEKDILHQEGVTYGRSGDGVNKSFVRKDGAISSHGLIRKDVAT